jgi:hypothetical protein
MGYQSAMANTRLDAVPKRTTRHPSVRAITPLRTSRSQLQRIIRDILHNNFIKFNVHSRLQDLGLPAQQELTPVKGILRMPILCRANV